jgi:RNA polymerase-binding transcription factor DksA
MDTNKYKKLLGEEKKKLLAEIKTIAQKNPANPKDWEAVEKDLEIDPADETEVADEFEELSENKAILDKLEPQLNQVELALKKIKDGTYGQCDICHEKIPTARLDANPASVTCIKHTK